MQSWRNAFQGKLSRDVNAAGVTLARFLWAGPIALLYLVGLYHWQDAPLPTWNLAVVSYAVGAALMQILATGLMVLLFQQRNFAIGAGLAKSEALIAAMLGTVFFGTQLSLLGWSGVLVGGVAIFLLSSKAGWRQLSLKTLVIGLASGASFALTSLWVREASLSLDLPYTHRAAWVLFIVITMQTLLLLVYLGWRQRQTLVQLWQRPKLVGATSLFSCIGSIGWFSAMSMQTVPYVKTLGQIEVLFTLLIAHFWLRDKLTRKDIAGLILIAVAAIMVMWG